MSKECEFDCPRIRSIQETTILDCLSSTPRLTNPYASSIVSNGIEQLSQALTESENCNGLRDKYVEVQKGIVHKRTVYEHSKVCGLDTNK